MKLGFSHEEFMARCESVGMNKSACDWAYEILVCPEIPTLVQQETLDFLMGMGIIELEEKNGEICRKLIPYTDLGIEAWAEINGVLGTPGA